MKKLITITIILFASLLSFSQEPGTRHGSFGFGKNTQHPELKSTDAYTLIVGYTDPNEVYHISSNSSNTGDILVMNNGKLVIDSAVTFTQQGTVVCINGGQIVAKHCTLSVAGNMYFINHSQLNVDTSSFIMPMQYRYQWGLMGLDTATVSFSGSTLSFGNGTLTGFFDNHASYILHHANFLQSNTISMTGHSILDVDHTQNAWEFLVSDTCNITIKNSNGFILWFYFQNSTPMQATFPMGNFVNGFVFNNTISGLSGIPYNVTIDSTTQVKWGIFPEKNSNVTINNSSLRTCGLIFTGNFADTLTGFYNNQFYSNNTFGFSDRYLHLNNSEIATWNFYAFDTAHISIYFSLFGEAIAFKDGHMTVMASTCDGSGGYIGTEDGEIDILNSQINAQLLSESTNTTIFAESNINYQLSTTFVNSTLALIANSTYNMPMVVADTSFVLEIFIDTLSHASVNDIVMLSGTVRTLNGPYNSYFMNRYDVYYAPIATPNARTLIADFLTQEITDNDFAAWNTNGLTPGQYIIYVDAYINNGTTPISISRVVNLGNFMDAETLKKKPQFTICPNPVQDWLHIEGSENIRRLEIVDIGGHVLFSQAFPFCGKSCTFPVDFLKPSTYLCRINSEHSVLFSKIP
ncbi:MAG: hypothetical protein V2A54_04665 [Bacteroidota bacterium]